MSKTATMYLRCSTRKQLRGSSLERQLRYCRLWCRETGVDPAGMVVDIGSGYSGNHLKPHNSRFQGHLGRTLAGYESGLVEKPDYFIYEEMDRLSRNPLIAYEIHERLAAIGVEARCVGMCDTDEDFWRVPALTPDERVAIHRL